MAKDLSREGHRERVRKQYLNTGIQGMQDHHILELILFFAIPRKDVKDVAYNIMNHFDNRLDRVLEADVEELMKINGVGESSAVLLTLFKKVNDVAEARKNSDVKSLPSWVEAKEYATNELKNLLNERLILITLNNNLEIINCHTVSNGTVSHANVEPRKLVECAIKDNAAAVILAHNHPKGNYLPSEEDLIFTKNIAILLNSLNIKLNDHIIVGENGTLSLSYDERYMSFLDV